MARGQLTQARAVIAEGESLSTPVDLRDYELVGIVMPGDWDAADITFGGRLYPADIAGNSADYLDVVDAEGNEVTITADADQYVVCTPAILVAVYGLQQVVVRSGPSGSEVVQGADRELVLVLQPR